ncbi:MAG: outer membrane protein transport protein [Gammaproteobacteria bacterium]|jgi:long-chain fatty acid transport protein
MDKRILLLSCCLISSQVFASALYNDSQSVSAMGNAFAGAGAAGDDASIMFYNPAGLTLIEDPEVVLSGIYAIPDSVLTVTHAEDSFGDEVPDAVGQQYSAIPEQFIPAFYTAMPIGEQFVLGVSMTSPYAIVTEYPQGSDVQGSALKTSFISYTGNLSLAMQVTEALSLGAGVNAQYFKAKMNANIWQLGTPNSIFTQYEGDDVAFYPNFGALYQFTERTRLGLNYRMQVKQDTQGDFSLAFIQPGNPTEMLTVPAGTNFYFPDIVSLNLFHDVSDRVEFLADVAFTHWDILEYITVDTDIPILGSSTPINSDISFKNTWRAGVGVNYIWSPEIKFRTGAAYDESPVVNATRTLQGPDSNRVEVAVGMMYKPKGWENTHFDIAYMHSFFADATVSQVNPLYAIFPELEFSGVTTAGYYNTSADFIGVQIVQSM